MSKAYQTKKDTFYKLYKPSHRSVLDKLLEDGEKWIFSTLTVITSISTLTQQTTQHLYSSSSPSSSQDASHVPSHQQWHWAQWLHLFHIHALYVPSILISSVSCHTPQHYWVIHSHMYILCNFPSLTVLLVLHLIITLFILLLPHCMFGDAAVRPLISPQGWIKVYLYTSLANIIRLSFIFIAI